MLNVLILCSQVSLILEPSSSVVRFGDAFELTVQVDNPQQATLAGYQLGFGWDTSSFQMSGEPFVLPGFALQDLFSFNAPPYGSGWVSAPSAGDGLDRDCAFMLSVAMTPSRYFSATSGSLCAIPYIAMQATQQGPVAMVFDEFASLIGQLTIVSDASGTSVTNTLINAQVEVVPNISVTGTFQLGSVLSLELHDEPGHPFRVFGCLQAANYNLNSIMGTVFVDFLHPSFRTIATGTTSAGPSLLNLNLPANPSLSGVTAHIQATSGANSDQRMTNSCSFVLQ